jgi:hypothetical protein
VIRGSFSVTNGGSHHFLIIKKNDKSIYPHE